MADGNNPDEGTANGGALSLDQAAEHLSTVLDDAPDTQRRETEQKASEAQQSGADEGNEVRDPDDWDTDQTEAASEAEEAEEGSEGDKPSEDGRFVGDTAKVRLPDGKVVTVAELRSGSMMQADYTRKTQELAETRKAAEARHAEIQQQERLIAQQRDIVLNLAQQYLPQEPDIGLLSADPVSYLQRKHDYDQRMGQLQQLMGTQAQQQQLTAQQQQEAHTQRVSAEMDKFFERNPALRDPKKANAFIGEMADYVGQYGISREEALAVVDHRFAQVLMDATRYHRIQKNRDKSVKEVQGKPQVVQPARRLSREATNARELEQSRDRLSKTHSMGDAASLISKLNLG